MTWPFTSRAGGGIITPTQLLADRTAARMNGRRVDGATAMRHSAVWACLRLRADLLSTMPLDVLKRVRTDTGSVQVEMNKPPVLTSPDGVWPIEDWLYASQVDLDRYGNAFGVIRARDGAGLPALIELVDAATVTVRGSGPRIEEYVFGRDHYSPEEVWHERQYPIAGMPLGLSPIGYAAMSIEGWLSAQHFMVEWFNGSAMPAAALKNTERTVPAVEAAAIKTRYTASVRNGDVFVHGKDWEFSTVGAKASESSFLDVGRYSISDVCRFLGVPGDMIDAESSTGSITYANVTQRNLQLLILNLAPVLRRRESAFSRRLLPQPRYVKFNRGSLLEMDLKTRYESYKVAVEARTLAPSEVRELENRQPFTTDQLAEFDRLFGKGTAPAPAKGVPA